MARLIWLTATALALGACVPTTGSNWLLKPADPTVPVRPTGYAPVTAGVQRFDVVSPRDWRELNERVAPGARPAADDTSAGSARRGR